MASIIVFIIAFGLGCLTGAVVHYFYLNPHKRDSTRTSPFRTSTADD
jgi:hypothetical protein